MGLKTRSDFKIKPLYDLVDLCNPQLSAGCMRLGYLVHLLYRRITDPDQSTFLWESWLDLPLILIHIIPFTQDHGRSLELERFLCAVLLIHKGQRNE